MKRNILLLIIIFATTFVVSCENQLDIPQQGVLDPEMVYANATDNDAESLMASLMAEFKQWHGTYTYIALNVISDDHYCGGQSFSDAAARYRQLGEYTYSPNTGEIQSIYTYCYKINYWANMIIENIVPDSDVKKRIVAEAHFFRAYCHLFAIRLWGTPSFIDHVLAPDEYNQPNGDPAVMWPWIEEEFKIAAEGLPSKGSKGGQEAIGGRPSREAAYAYLGRALLQQGKYAECAQILKDKVISTNYYELQPDMSKLLRASSDFCDEYIFESNITNDDVTGSAQGVSAAMHMHWRSNYTAMPSAGAPSGWGMPNPSKDFGEFLSEYDQKIDGTMSQRYYYQLADYETVLKMDYSEGVTPGLLSSAADHAGWYSMRQFLWKDDIILGTTQGSSTAYRSHKNPVHMKYAEVLLNYAEAAFQSGDAAGALSAVNEVRTRAGIEPYGSIDMDKIKDERRAELFLECLRFFDLVRWGDAPTALADKGKVKYSFEGYKDRGHTPESRDQWEVIQYPGNGGGFVVGKHEVFPFPISEVENNPNLKQNPGW